MRECIDFTTSTTKCKGYRIIIEFLMLRVYDTLYMSAASESKPAFSVQTPMSEQRVFSPFSFMVPAVVVHDMFVVVATRVDSLHAKEQPHETVFDLAVKLSESLPDGYTHRRGGMEVMVELDANEMSMISSSVGDFPDAFAERLACYSPMQTADERRRALTDAHGLFRETFERAAGIFQEEAPAGVIMEPIYQPGDLRAIAARRRDQLTK